MTGAHIFDWPRSARSARKHRAWGVSPRKKSTNRWRACGAGDSKGVGAESDDWSCENFMKGKANTSISYRLFASAVARSAGCDDLLIKFPGLTPRALCFRALRALSSRVIQETMPVLISGAREAGDLSVSSSEFELRVKNNATAPLSGGSPLRGSYKFCFTGNPRLAEPRLGLNYSRCFAAC